MKPGVMQLAQRQTVGLGADGIRAKRAMVVHAPVIIAACHAAIPLDRYGSEDEATSVIVVLRSRKASYVAGQGIVSNGRVLPIGVGLPTLRV